MRINAFHHCMDIHFNFIKNKSRLRRLSKLLRYTDKKMWISRCIPQNKLRMMGAKKISWYTSSGKVFVPFKWFCTKKKNFECETWETTMTNYPIILTEDSQSPIRILEYCFFVFQYSSHQWPCEIHPPISLN